MRFAHDSSWDVWCNECPKYKTMHALNRIGNKHCDNNESPFKHLQTKWYSKRFRLIFSYSIYFSGNEMNSFVKHTTAATSVLFVIWSEIDYFAYYLKLEESRTQFDLSHSPHTIFYNTNLYRRSKSLQSFARRYFIVSFSLAFCLCFLYAWLVFSFVPL